MDDGFRSSSDEETWTVLSNLAFLGPPKFSVDRLLDIAIARYRNMRDHLRLLQTDVYYARNETQYFRQLGQVNVQYDTTRQFLASKWVHAKLCTYPTLRVFHWYAIVEECRYMQKQYRRFSDNIQFGNVLPSGYAKALHCLEVLLVNILRRRAKELGDLLPWTRGFEACYAPTG